MLQPSVLYLLLSLILVHPAFDVFVKEPASHEGAALVKAMRDVGSPIGEHYINPVIVQTQQPGDLRQVISVEIRAGTPTAVQRFGLIDSNQVKNLRNRLTASALRIWNAALGGRAVVVEEVPWLPHDIPYTVYFGMAMLPLAVFLGGAIVGAVLTAQDFEFATIAEYRIAPTSSLLLLGTRLVRLVISILLPAGLLLLVVGWRTGYWPDPAWRLVLALLPSALIASCLGVGLGLVFQRSLPAFLIGLCLSLASWIFGSGFGLASTFGGIYEQISRLTPNAYTVQLLFPCYYGITVGDSKASCLLLLGYSLVATALLVVVYRREVMARQ